MLNINTELTKEDIHPFITRIPFPCETLQKVFELAFSHNGFVSGGYAIIVGRAHHGIISIQEYISQAQRHIMPINMSYYNANSDTIKYKKDIDLFFPNEEDELKFIANFKKFFSKEILSFEESDKGFAYNVLMNDGVKVQIVQSNKFVWNTIEQILSSFDILNCSIAFNEKQIIFPSSWKMLEEAKMIHVNKWGAWTISRVLKYFRKGYRALSEKTSTSLYEGIDKYSTHQNMNIPNKDEAKQKIHDVIQQIFGYTKKTLTDKQVIEFTMLLPSTYSGAFRELEKRHQQRVLGTTI